MVYYKKEVIKPEFRFQPEGSDRAVGTTGKELAESEITGGGLGVKHGWV